MNMFASAAIFSLISGYIGAMVWHRRAFRHRMRFVWMRLSLRDRQRRLAAAHEDQLTD